MPQISIPRQNGSDFRMNFEVHPGGLSRPALFIHGNLASNRWWFPMLGVLREQKRPSVPRAGGEVILAEWRGCGQSGRLHSPEELDPFLLARDYIALLRKHGLTEPVDVVGHSTGGVIAICAVLQAPDLFRSVTLLNSVAPTGRVTTPENRRLLERMQGDRAVCSKMMAATMYAPRTLSSGGIPDRDFFEKLMDDTMGVDPGIWLGVPDMLEKVRLQSLLRDVRVPVLILHGDQDPILPIAGAMEWEECLPEARLVLLKGQGHSCNIESPERVVAELDRFWTWLSGRPTLGQSFRSCLERGR